MLYLRALDTRRLIDFIVLEHHRPLPREFEYTNRSGDVQAGAFADGFPFLLTVSSSLDDLNRKMSENCSETLIMERFRPNIVIEGPSAWEEDGYKTVKIGNHVSSLLLLLRIEKRYSFKHASSKVFDSVKPCGRCTMPSVCPITAKRLKRFEPTPTLRKFRKIIKKDGEEDLLFGVNLVQVDPYGSVKIGDVVEILDTKAGPQLVS